MFFYTFRNSAGRFWIMWSKSCKGVGKFPVKLFVQAGKMIHFPALIQEEIFSFVLQKTRVLISPIACFYNTMKKIPLIDVVISAKCSPFFSYSFFIIDVQHSTIVTGKDITTVIPTIATARATSDGYKV